MRILITLILAVVLLLPQEARAFISSTAQGEATTYNFTLQKLELCTVSGSVFDTSGVSAPVCGNPFVIGTGTQTFQLGDDNGNAPGANVGTYAQISQSGWQTQLGNVFGYIRVTLSRDGSRAGTVALAGPPSGFCTSGAGDGTITASAAGYGTAHAPVASHMFFLTPGSSAIGADTATGLKQKGQVVLDASTYTQMIPLTAPYTATPTLPTIKVSFDMQTALQAAWTTEQFCDGSPTTGSRCCMYNGDVGVHITFQ